MEKAGGPTLWVLSPQTIVEPERTASKESEEECIRNTRSLPLGIKESQTKNIWRKDQENEVSWVSNA